MAKLGVPSALKTWILPLIAGCVLGILAPFGTNLFSPFFRFAYWIGLTFAGGLGAHALHMLFLKTRPERGLWFHAFIQSLGATAAVLPFVLYLNADFQIFGILLSLFYVWIIAIIISVIGQLSAKAGEANSTVNVTELRPALFDRLPPKFRNEPLHAISSEDHYVRIHSAAGEHMLLMRLSDAEDLAAPIKGLKPHRSWWVAEAGVERVEKSSGKLRITLKSGTEVPVSREGTKRVREAGWI